MRQILIGLVALSLLPFNSVAAQRKNGRAIRNIKAERELRRTEREWDDAIVRRDAVALNRILADDFVLTDAAGGLSNKQQLINTVMSPDLVIEPFTTEDVRISIYGNTAVVSGRFTQRGSYKGRAFSFQYRYMDVYVKRQDGWQAIAAQSTRINPQ